MKTIARSLFTLLYVVALMGVQVAPSVAADPVRFALDWVPYGKHSGFFAAVDRGLLHQGRPGGQNPAGLRGEHLEDTCRRASRLHHCRDRSAHRPPGQGAYGEDPRECSMTSPFLLSIHSKTRASGRPRTLKGRESLHPSTPWSGSFSPPSQSMRA